ncbi:MAG: TIGR00341 family protein [Pseudomonadota bacterium]
MAFRRIEVEADAKHANALLTAIKDCKPTDIRVVEDEKNKRIRILSLVRQESGQSLVDAVQKTLQASQDWRLFVLPVEATLPKVAEPAPKKEAKATDQNGKKENNKSNVIREEVFEDVAANGRLTNTYLILTALSAVVAALGLNMDSVAVVIGAMVIAPLLGPQLALSFGIALGARDLVIRSSITAAVGSAFAVVLAYGIGHVVEVDLSSQELVSRTTVNIESIVLALASGAAAALSLLTGLSTTLVGVMVAVALLPPATVCGLMFAAGEPQASFGALMLLVANIICVNLSAQVVFLSRGVGPRSTLKQKTARRSGWFTIGIWAMLLAIFVVFIMPRIQGI